MGWFYTNVAKYGKNMQVKLVNNETGERRKLSIPFSPELFIDFPDMRAKETDFVGSLGEKVTRVEFPNCKAAQDFLDEWEDSDDHGIYGNDDWVSQFITRYFKGDIKYDFKHIRVANVDIEVMGGYINDAGKVVKPKHMTHATVHFDTFKDMADEEAYVTHLNNFNHWYAKEFPDVRIPDYKRLGMGADFPVNLIQLSDWKTGKRYIWGLPIKENQGMRDQMVLDDCVEYYEFKSEVQLLYAFLKFWQQQDYDIFTGWNVKQFDVPYLWRRITKLMGDDYASMMSPFGRIWSYETKNTHKKYFTNVLLYGCEVVDYQELYITRCAQKRRSYRLDYIANLVLKRGKINYAEYDNIFNFQFKNWPKFVSYGDTDIKRVDEINDRLHYMQLNTSIAYIAKCSYSRALKTVSPWVGLMRSFMYEQGVVSKFLEEQYESVSYEGGYVKKDVLPGRYDWDVTIDLNSLYPHNIQQYNIGKETLVETRERSEIIFELVNEIEDKIANEPSPDRQIAFRQLQNKIETSDNRGLTDAIDEIIEVGVETYETLIKYNVSMTPNIMFFRNDKMSFLSQINRKIYASRKEHKKVELTHGQYVEWAEEHQEGKTFQEDDLGKVHSRYYNAPMVNQLTLAIRNATIGEFIDEFAEIRDSEHSFQYGYKILLNAGYGAVANKSMRDFFDIRLATSITAAGRIINKWNQHFLNKYLREHFGIENWLPIFYGDTDSNYITFAPVVEQRGMADKPVHEVVAWLDKLYVEEVEPEVVRITDILASTLNAYENRMFWEREVIADTAVWQAGKTYIMSVYDSEGTVYEDSHLKMIGVDAVTTTVSEWSAEKLEECYRVILSGTEKDLQAKVKEIREEFHNLPVHEISSGKGVNAIHKFEDPQTGDPISGTPGHSKAAIIYNRLVREKGFSIEYIEEGDRINLVDLVEANPTGYKKLAFKGEFPKELEEEYGEFIAYKQLFKSGFLDQLDNILKAINWDSVYKNDLFKMAGGDIAKPTNVAPVIPGKVIRRTAPPTPDKTAKPLW